MQKFIFLFILLLICQFSFATTQSTGKKLYETRCAMCHGADARATGLLAQKSNPPTPDLTSCAFQKKLAKYPGAIISPIVLRPNGNLIPETLKKNGVIVPPMTWTEDDLRAINQYMLTLISKRHCMK